MNAIEKTKATEAALKDVQHKAFVSGTSRNDLLNSIALACGPKPTLLLFEKVRLTVVGSFMAAALVRKGDNRTEAALTSYCREAILHKQGANGSAKLRKGQKGRRTQVEEDAYSSARVLASRLWEAAGVKVPTKSGSNSNSKAKAAAKKATKKAVREATSDKPAIRKFTSAEKFVEYALIQGKAMQGSLNKSAAIVPAGAGTAINTFLTAMLAVADELGMKA